MTTVKRWYSKAVTVDEIEMTLKEIQEPFFNAKTYGQIKFILEKTNGQFLIVWCEEKSVDNSASFVMNIQPVKDLN